MSAVLHRWSNCPLSWAMDAHIMCCGTTSPCQSAVTSKIVKRCCSRVFSCKQRYVKYADLYHYPSMCGCWKAPNMTVTSFDSVIHWRMQTSRISTLLRGFTRESFPWVIQPNSTQQRAAGSSIGTILRPSSIISKKRLTHGLVQFRLHSHWYKYESGYPCTVLVNTILHVSQ